MKPAWRWCFLANWRTSCSGTTWPASMHSPTACCSLTNPPYAQKLNTPGLFLREVAMRGRALSALLTPHLGTGFTDPRGTMNRMVGLMNSAPVLDPNRADQVAALPLGGRVKLNPWDDRVELTKATPMAIASARYKMPLEVTPFFPWLTRSEAAVNPTATANAANPSPSN